MEYLSKGWELLHSEIALAILLGLLAASEYLASTDKFKASSVIQAVKNALGWIKSKLLPAK